MHYQLLEEHFWHGIILLSKKLRNRGRQDGKRHQDHEDLRTMLSKHIIGHSFIRNGCTAIAHFSQAKATRVVPPHGNNTGGNE